MLNQIISTFCLITGIITGETISNKVFGINKKWYLNIIEIMLFIIIINILFNRLYVTELNNTILFLTNFLFGITAITITHGITSGAGFLTKKVTKKQRKPKTNQETVIISLTRNLLRKGLSKTEIKSILNNSGFNKRKTNRIMKRIMIKKQEKYKEPKGTKQQIP